MSRRKLKFTPTAQAKTTPSVDTLFAKIIEQTADFSRKDIKKWRGALQSYTSSAESSTLAPLQQIYQDLLMDGHVSSQILLRKSSILNTAYVALVNDEIDEEWTKLFNQSEWVYHLTETILDTIFTGTTVIEFTQVLPDSVDFEEIPKTHVNPKYKRIYIDANDLSKFIDYEQPQFQTTLVQIGKDTHIGILNNIVPQLIWSRYAEQSWSEFCERFGLPMITATSNKNNASEISKLEKKISTIGEGLTAVLPTGTTIDIKQPNNADAYLVFEKRIHKCEDKISKQILAGTMITDSGSSRSQSEVHERNLDDKISLMDMRFNEFTWNNKILPILKQRGFQIPDNFYLKLDISDKVDYTKLIDFIIKLLDTYEIPLEWLEKTFGIPLSAKNEQSTTNNKNKEQGTKTKEEEKKLAYTELNQFFHTLIEKYHVPKSFIERELSIPLDSLPRIIGETKPSSLEVFYTHASCSICAVDSPPLEGLGEVFSASSNTLRDRLSEGFFNVAESLFKGSLNAKQKRALTSIYQELFGEAVNQHFDIGSVDFKTPDGLCRLAMESNLFEFSSAKTSHITDQLNRALFDGDKRRTWSEYKQVVDGLDITYNKHYLQAEYSHAVAVGQTSRAWFKLWKDRAEMPYMEYQTVGDSHVRDSHALLNHKVFEITDTEAQKLFPPNGWRCRCEMLAYLGKLMTLSKGKEAIQLMQSEQGDTKKTTHFLLNFAVEKLVFTDEQIALYSA